jgi:hypothetical protein
MRIVLEFHNRIFEGHIIICLEQSPRPRRWLSAANRRVDIFRRVPFYILDIIFVIISVQEFQLVHFFLFSWPVGSYSWRFWLFLYELLTLSIDFCLVRRTIDIYTSALGIFLPRTTLAVAIKILEPFFTAKDVVESYWGWLA